jgi:hypothetical protein
MCVAGAINKISIETVYETELITSASRNGLEVHLPICHLKIKKIKGGVECGVLFDKSAAFTLASNTANLRAKRRVVTLSKISLEFNNFIF